MKRFEVKRLQDGRAMLNLACGGQMHPEWNNLDFSPLVRLAQYPRAARLLNRLGILSNRRYERVLATDPDIICWDLRKGIPFESDTFDVVYHSHFLEHLDRSSAHGLLEECRRVLKPSGILRVVVPDLQQFCRNYLNSCEHLAQLPQLSEESMERHQRVVSKLIGQMVVGEPYGTSQQPRLVRMFERLVRGNNVKAGEVHRWMYDGFTLRQLLSDVGFARVKLETYQSGGIEDWSTSALDTDEDGGPSKSLSLYTEARK